MGLFEAIFNKIKINRVSGYFGYWARSSPFEGEIWDNDLARAIIDTIATHAAKGKLEHVRVGADGKIKERIHDSELVKLINEKPNEFMTGYDLKYRFFSTLYRKTTAVMYIKYAGERAVGIYPVDFSSYEFREIIGGGWAIQFTDQEGTENVLPLDCCVVMRRFYSERQASGDGNAPFYKVLDMSKASDEGFIEALTVSNKVRGLVKQKKAMLDPDDVKKGQEDFARRFENAAKKGGIVAVDSMEDFQPLNVNTYSANAAQNREIFSRFYSYFRTPEEILQSKYSEQTGLAWYESVIEPLWEQLAEALGNAYFTEREKGHGNRLMVAGGVLMGTSYQTRMNIIAQTKELGVLTINEQRDLLGFAPVEGGDIRLVSLNYIDSTKANEYQTGKKAEDDQKDQDKKEENEGNEYDGGEEAKGSGLAQLQSADKRG